MSVVRPVASPAVALFLLVCAVFGREVLNGFIWDDPEYVVNNPTLKTPGGVVDIWLRPTALPQYYPVVHSTFWLEARLWGTDRATGYHVDNVLLHALAVVLLWRVLSMLELPGAWFAAALFAVHPVTVESVAWVTERKNVLSLCLYLAAMAAYFRHSPFTASQPAKNPSRESGRGAIYALSLLLFTLALLSKTVTCSLPAAILLLTYWKRGRLTRIDVRPTVPLFAIGLSLAAFTAYFESSHVGATGRDFAFSPADRILIAGRAVCYYFRELLWPVNLMFIYPKWTITPAIAIYPAAVVAVLVALWLPRRKIGRGPIVATLLYVGTLTPALGFVNVYPMRYSFVADHFQYHAMPAVIAGVVCGIFTLFSGRLEGTLVPTPKRVPSGLPLKGGILILIVLLAILTWRRQAVYHDAETLWRDTVEKNPTSWMAHVNLANALRHDHQPDKADDESFEALRLEPNEPDTHYEVGNVYQRHGRRADAIAEFRKALALSPDFPPIQSSLARVLWDANTTESQLEAYRLATAAHTKDPSMADAADVLGQEKMAVGDYRGAIPLFEAAAQNTSSQLPRTHVDLGTCLLKVGRPADARLEFQRALSVDPNFSPAAGAIKRLSTGN